MDELVRVNTENCEQVAQRIIKTLAEKNFSIVSFYHNLTGRREPPVVLDRMWLKGTYSFKDNCIKIDLYPIRSIFWDLIDEQVSVNFLDDGNIVIERVLPKGRTLYRVLIAP